VSTCNVTYTPEVIRDGTRTFYWRRFKTPGGILYLLSIPVLITAICFIYLFDGANWFVGAFGLLLVMNLIVQGTTYFSLPRVLASRFSDPSRRTIAIETLPDGFRSHGDRSVTFFPWSNLRYIWLYGEFILLVPPHPALRAAFVLVPTEGMTPEVRHDFEVASQSRSPNQRLERP
jgi:hypothetical protein